MRFRLQPVAWLTTLATVVIALAGTQVVTDALPRPAAGWLTGAAAPVTVVLGWRARAVVTPLARPRANDGRKLVAYPITVPFLPEDGTAGASTPTTGSAAP